MNTYQHLKCRDRVVKEAIKWLKTPYAHYQRLKNVGVDCGCLLAEVYEKAKIIPHVEISYYPIDWHLHRSKEEFFSYLKPFAKKEYTLSEQKPKPADIALFRYGRCVSHSAIVINYPIAIHAYMEWGCVAYCNIETDLDLKKRLVKFVDIIGDADD